MNIRIVTVADVFDALTAGRPYRTAMPLDKAVSIIEADVGLAFDRECVDALVSGRYDLLQTKRNDLAA